MRDLVVSTAGVVVALGLGVAAHRTRAELGLAARTAVARATGVSLEAVALERASIGLSGLQLDGLSAGQLAIGHARFVPRMASLFGGRLDGTLYLETILVEDPPLGAFDRISVDRADVTLGEHLRVHAHDVVGELGAWARGLPVHVGDLGVEVERHGFAMRRAAFTSLSVGPLQDLAGGLHRRDGVVSLSAAATGVHLLAQLLDDGMAASVTFERFGLAFDDTTLPWLASLGVPSGQLALTGTAELRVPRGEPAEVELDVATVGAVRAPRLAPRPISVDGVTVEARGEIDDGADSATVVPSRKEAKLETTISLSPADDDNDDEGATVAVTTTLPELPCSALLAALPEALRPALDGMSVEGSIAGTLSTRVPLDAPDQLTLDGDLKNRCVVLSEPPLADVLKLRSEAPLLPSARDAEGRPRAFEVGRGNPSFRALDQLPRVVVDTFVEAEDGRFFRHSGVDLAQIHRALSHDLESGTAGRGGSTITQQVAKNLFLSGERTIGRKLEEAVLAWRLEQQLGKRRILELYLNLAELGPGIYGVAEGARAYFHKDVAQLNADEATQLAALLPAPRRGMDEAWSRRHAQLVARLPGALASRRQP